MCSAAAASIRGEVVVKTKPNQSYSPDSPRGTVQYSTVKYSTVQYPIRAILQILLVVPLLFSAAIGAALSPPNADYIVFGLLFFLQVQ